MMLPGWPTVRARLPPWLHLAKVGLCLPVAGSAAFGCILQTPATTPVLGAVMVAVFLLACGAAAANSLQEADADALMDRTRRRPLVTGRLSRRAAAGFSACTVCLGLLTLAAATPGWTPTLLGLAALLLYNGVYTPLKQRTVFALLAGGLVGSLPPLIGWTAGGGLLTDSRSWLLAGLFFLWQIPHFCLILLHHGPEYQAIAQPTLIRLLPPASLNRIVLVWVLALAVAALTLSLERQLLAPGSRLVLALMAALLIASALALGWRTKTPDYRRLFLGLNGLFFSALLLIAMLQLLLPG